MDVNSQKDPGNFFTFQARMASYTGISGSALFHDSFRWILLAIGVMVLAITLVCEEAGERWKVLLTCLAGGIVSLLVSFTSAGFLLEISIFMIGFLAAGAVLIRGSGLFRFGNTRRT
jgi:hypothetical protein